MRCIWCEGDNAVPAKKNCKWIEPGGAEVITVKDVPAIDCPQCRDIYTDDDVNAEIELALMSVNLAELGAEFSYDDLLKAPKMSIFDMYRNGASFRCNK